MPRLVSRSRDCGSPSYMRPANYSRGRRQDLLRRPYAVDAEITCRHATMYRRKAQESSQRRRASARLSGADAAGFAPPSRRQLPALTRPQSSRARRLFEAPRAYHFPCQLGRHQTTCCRASEAGHISPREQPARPSSTKPFRAAASFRATSRCALVSPRVRQTGRV